MDYDLEEALLQLRRLNDAARKVRGDRRDCRRQLPDLRLREQTLIDQRNELIVAVLENLSTPITQARLARALGLSRERLRQIVDHTRRRLNTT